MSKRHFLATIAISLVALSAFGQNFRSEKTLTDWEFRHGHE